MEVRLRLPSFLTLFFCNVSAPAEGVGPDERSRIAVAIYRSAAFHFAIRRIVKTLAQPIVTRMADLLSAIATAAAGP
jgi:hypothetical protein